MTSFLQFLHFIFGYELPKHIGGFLTVIFVAVLMVVLATGVLFGVAIIVDSFGSGRDDTRSHNKLFSAWTNWLLGLFILTVSAVLAIMIAICSLWQPNSMDSWANQTNTFAGKSVHANYKNTTKETFTKSDIVNIDYSNTNESGIVFTTNTGGKYTKISINQPVTYLVSETKKSPTIVIYKKNYVVNNSSVSKFYLNDTLNINSYFDSRVISLNLKPITNKRANVSVTTKVVVYVSENDYNNHFASEVNN